MLENVWISIVLTQVSYCCDIVYLFTVVILIAKRLFLSNKTFTKCSSLTSNVLYNLFVFFLNILVINYFKLRLKIAVMYGLGFMFRA